MKKIKKVYIDIESTYAGQIDPEKDRSGFFKDYENWKFLCDKECNGKNVIYQGIIGILALDFNFDEDTEIYKLLNNNFVQLIGNDITKERLMKELEGMTDIIGYHCRTKPDWRGYTGYDYGVIGAQLGVILDELPGINSIDLELLAHQAKMFGGLKGLEMQIPTVPKRRSGVDDGAEEEKLLLEIAYCDDEKVKKNLWNKALTYNREDVINLVYIEQYLKNIKIVE